MGDASGEGSVADLAIISANGGIVINSDSIALTLANASDGLSSTTSSGSGLEILSSGLSLLQGCANNDVLKWNEVADVWACASDESGAAGGEATIKAGDTSVDVKFDHPYNGQLPIVTVNLKDGQFLTYSYRDLTSEGFIIVLQQPAVQNTQFAWTALSTH